MLFYHIAKEKFEIGHRFERHGMRPLQELCPHVEDILERNRPHSMLERGSIVYLKKDKDFSQVGVWFDEGFIHTVNPVDDPVSRDLTWTGVLQGRYPRDEHIKIRPGCNLTDDQVAEQWWKGAASEAPNWEWITNAAIVTHVEEDPVKVRPNSPLLDLLSH